MNSRKAKIAVSIGLVLAVALVFGQTIGHQFHEGDDKEFVYGNGHVRAGLTADGMHWAFTAGPYGEWYPLAVVSHMLDCQLFGLKPGGHYLTSLLLHAASSVLLFLVLLRMTGQRAVPGTDQRLVAAQVSGGRVASAGPSATAPQRAVPGTDQRLVAAQVSGGRVAPAGPSAKTLWPSAFVAALFAIHPQHVESVAWVAERKDVLSGLFFMLTLAAYLDYVRRGRPLVGYLMVVVLFALGLLSKPMLVTLPPLLLLLDFWPLGRIGAVEDVAESTALAQRPSTVRLVLEKLPLLALAVADCLMTLRTHNLGNATLSWSVRAANAPIACVTYIGQFLFPVGLTMSHPALPGGPAKIAVVCAAAILVAISAAAVIWRRRCPYLFVGWFWFLGMLFPVLGLVNLGGAFTMADRYMYLPGIGLYIVLAWGGARLGEKWPRQSWLLGTCGALAIAVLAICGVCQTSVWHDDVTMWRHALACSPGSVEAEGGLADALWRQGRLDDAIPLYQRAIRHAEDSVPFTNFGMVMAQLGKLDEAAALLRRAVAIQPGSYNAQIDLGLVLTQRRELKQAQEHFRRAVELNPRGASAHYGLARLLLFEGQAEEACQEFQQAIVLNPVDPAIRSDLAAVLLKRGKIDEALTQLHAALAIDANSVMVHVNLARALAMRGQHAAALDHCHRALAINPRNVVARAELDELLHAQAARPNR